MIFTTNNKKARLLTLGKGPIQILEVRNSKEGFTNQDIEALNATETRGKWCMESI